VSDGDPDGRVTLRVGESVSSFDAAAWDACAGDANPFVSHAFLSALEDSGSAVARTGWQPLPIAFDEADGSLAGVAPAYAKSHSQGEYVFDHSWADAWERAGGRYFPKLLIASPFSPVPGPRLLARTADAARALIAGAEALVDRHSMSGAHANFVADDQLDLFRDAGWLIREGTQFHWANRGYATFDDFLGDLASRKRKAIRKERSSAVDGLDIVHLSGNDLTEAHWDAFWYFYQDTGSRKWGQPYLTRAFFPLLGAALGDRVLLSPHSASFNEGGELRPGIQWAVRAVLTALISPPRRPRAGRARGGQCRIRAIKET
jgi:predicted N-acyltransferase